jgi:DNA-binding MarR family transcriptional regulator
MPDAGSEELPPSPREIAQAWRRERPGTPTESIEIVTPIWRLAKLFAEDRARVLREQGIDAATLDLLSVLRRSGPPYALTSGQIARRALVTAGAISQRLAKAEREGLVGRSAGTAARHSVLVTLTPAGRELIERSVDAVLGREADLVASLSAQERETLTGLLEKLTGQVVQRVANGDDEG